MRIPTTERVFQIFKELNQIPRPSHHEERVADYLCQFAERLHLTYKRDAENCIVISKPATPGHEDAEPIVLLNHMDMVCVGMSDPLNSPVEAYVENGWAFDELIMEQRGTTYWVHFAVRPKDNRRKILFDCRQKLSAGA